MDADLIAFLTARLDEDEAAAMAATPGPWEFEPDDEVFTVHDGKHGDLVGDTVAFTRHREEANGEHVARHDPARVLRDVEAGRCLIEAYHDRAEWARELRDPDTGYRNITEGEARWEEGATAALLAAIQFRASVYSDNPAYREEWKL